MGACSPEVRILHLAFCHCGTGGGVRLTVNQLSKNVVRSNRTSDIKLETHDHT